jgi:hypothetical protein
LWEEVGRGKREEERGGGKGREKKVEPRSRVWEFG